MVHAAFVFCWFALLVVWLAVMNRARLLSSHITLPGYVIAFMLVTQYLGIPALYFGLDRYRVEDVTDPLIMLKVWSMTSTCITLMIAGSILASNAFPLMQWRQLQFAPLSRLSRHQRILLCAVGALCIGVLAIYVSRVGIAQLALAAALGVGDNMTVTFARSKMTNDFEGGYFWFQFFMQKMLMLVFLIFFAQWLLNRAKDRLLLTIFGVSSVVALIIGGEKGLLVKLFLGAFLAVLFTRHGGRVRWSVLAGFTAVVVLTMIAMNLLFMNAEGALIATSSAASRVLTGGIQPAYHYLEIFPHVHSFLLGTSLPNPGGLLPFQPFLLTTEVWAYVHPSAAAEGVVGSMPTIYWGDMYANFGFIGVLFASIAVGILLQIVGSALFTLRANPISIGFVVWIFLYYQDLAVTSLSNFLVDFGLFVAAFVVVILLMLGSDRRPMRG